MIYLNRFGKIEPTKQMIISARLKHALKSINLFIIIIASAIIAACSSSSKAPTSDVLGSSQSKQLPAENEGLTANAYQDDRIQSKPLFDNIEPLKEQTPKSKSELLSDPNQSPLSKVEELVLSKNYGEAQAIAQRIDRSRLSLQDQARLSLAEATIYSSTNQNELTLQSLESIQPSLLSLEDNSRFFWLKARTKYQTGDAQGALEALADRENYISQEEIPANQNMMQNILSALTEEQKQQISENTANPNLLYWLGSNRLGQFSSNSQYSQGAPAQTVYPNNAANIDSIWQTTSPRQIAVLLPFNSNFASAAKEFEQGFNQAHANNYNSSKPQLRFYDVGSGDIQTKMNIALQNGAELIVGPLGTRASKTALGINSPVPILTIGGQTFDNQSNQFTFSLTPESEGIAIAQHARAQGFQNAVILTPNTPQSARLSDAFQNTWQALGGTIETHEFSSGEYDHSTPVKLALGIYGSEQRYTELSNVIGIKPKFNVSRKESIDMILLASNYNDTKNLKPQLNFFDAFSVPTYGASSLNPLSAPTGEKADLDGLIIPEMPALVSPNNAENANNAPSQDNANLNNPNINNNVSRLQALGFDSYQIIPILNQLKTQQTSYQGKTGKLLMDMNGNIVRIPSWAKFSSGKLQAISP